MNLSLLIAIASLVISLASAVFALCIFIIHRRSVFLNVMTNLNYEYRSAGMHFSEKMLINFYKEYENKGKKELIKKYLEIKKEDDGIFKGIKNYEERLYFLQDTLFYHRRFVSQYYSHIAYLCYNKILPRRIVYQLWAEKDLRIIPDIIIPMEEGFIESREEFKPEDITENLTLRNLFLLYEYSKISSFMRWALYY